MCVVVVRVIGMAHGAWRHLLQKIEAAAVRTTLKENRAAGV